MEQTPLPAPLPDPEAFQRVWDRVMPDPALSPIVPVSPSPPASGQDVPLRLLELAAGRWDLCRALARRGGPWGRTLSAMAGDCRRQVRQLAALQFLLTGAAPLTHRSKELPLPPLPQALRQQYIQCTAWCRLCREWESTCTDPAQRSLCTALYQEGVRHMGLLRTMAEVLLSP